MRLHEVENPHLEVVKDADLHGIDEVGLQEATQEIGNMLKHVESSVDMARGVFSTSCLGVGITEHSIYISNNPSFRLKHPGVPDGSDGSGARSYPLTENQTRPVAQAKGRVAYLPCGGNYTMPLMLATRRVVYYARRSAVSLPLLCVRNVVTYTDYRNDTYVTLFAGVAVIQ
jgi:hypothetical protein